MSPEKAVQICDRNFGVGADGVIFVLPGINGTDYTMRIFNSDGSEPEVIDFSYELLGLHSPTSSLLFLILTPFFP